MRTPIDDTIQFVKERAKNMRYCSTSCVVLEILLELGVPTNMEGFAYLKDAIRLRYINPYWTVTNHIYPAISQKDGGLLSNDQIDTAIRSAIKVQRSADGTTWSNMRTYTKEDYSNLICENTASHASCVTYTGTPGYYYRAKITLYATNDEGIGSLTRYASSLHL